MKIFFSVGEPSGDLHGANLIKEIKRRDPSVEFVGYGGPKMKAVGCELHEDLTKLAVMWFLRVLLNIRTFWNLLCRANLYFREHPPDAVVMIDYPGFNWWIARRAKAHGIPVFYYGTPQMWAWAGWRVKKMRRFVDHVLCKLPFEVDWYQERGCTATYVGHPYFDELASRQVDEEFVSGLINRGQDLITILPGSRRQEVESNFPAFVQAAQLISKRRPDCRFAIAAFDQEQAELAKNLLSDTSINAQVFAGRTPELVAAANCCLACSGSVSLELLYHEKPTVIHYRIGRMAYFMQGFFRKVRYITLVNLLATEDRYCDHAEVYDPITDIHKVPFPEYLTCRDRTEAMADHICQWLGNAMSYAQVRQQLQDIKSRFLTVGASAKAAEYILNQMQIRQLSQKKDHSNSEAA